MENVIRLYYSPLVRARLISHLQIYQAPNYATEEGVSNGAYDPFKQTYGLEDARLTLDHLLANSRSEDISLLDDTTERSKEVLWDVQASSHVIRLKRIQ